MDPLRQALALLRRYRALEEGAHTFEEWDALTADVDAFLASYGHLAPEEHV